ncbi:MAG TPA: hypothetical protein PLN21_07290 [Gemmatales bacterium]|nr:hypothetical protein [Gemmatales bacterium]
MRTAVRIAAALIIMSGCGAGMFFWYQQYHQPTLRTEVAVPMYTVESSAVSKAIADGKQVVEFGPLPGSAFYAGAPAFHQPEEALVWLKSTGKYEQGWRVFELSGDYTLDTHLVRGLPFTNKTLQINREVALVP